MFVIKYIFRDKVEQESIITSNYIISRILSMLAKLALVPQMIPTKLFYSYFIKRLFLIQEVLIYGLTPLDATMKGVLITNNTMERKAQHSNIWVTI
jgi:uncharacterized SAM-binding protein YcdF (DUF218 family)